MGSLGSCGKHHLMPSIDQSQIQHHKNHPSSSLALLFPVSHLPRQNQLSHQQSHQSIRRCIAQSSPQLVHRMPNQWLRQQTHRPAFPIDHPLALPFPHEELLLYLLFRCCSSDVFTICAFLLKMVNTIIRFAYRKRTMMYDIEDLKSRALVESNILTQFILTANAQKRGEFKP